LVPSALLADAPTNTRPPTATLRTREESPTEPVRAPSAYVQGKVKVKGGLLLPWKGFTEDGGPRSKVFPLSCVRLRDAVPSNVSARVPK